MEPNSDKLGEILAAQKKALDEWTKFQNETGAKVRTIEGTVAQLADVPATIKALQESVGGLQEVLKRRANGVLPGMEDEFNKKADGTDAFSVTKLLFDPKSKERSIIAEYTEKRRDLSQGVDTAGGFTVPQEVLPKFLEAIRAQAVVWPNAGITVLDNLRGSPVTVPKEVGSTTVQWVGENVAPTPTDVTFGQLSLTPKKVAGLVKVSQRLIRMGSIAEQVVRRNLSRSIALEIDRVLLRGTGASGEPRGLANTAGILNVEIDTNGGPFTFKVAADQVVAVDETNVMPNNQGFVGHPRAFHSMKTERIAQFSGQTAGAYVVLPMNDQQISDLLGYKFLRTTTIPKNLTKGSGTALTEVYFGNWADLWLGIWTDLVFKASDVTGDSTGSAFTQDQLWIMCQMECDIAVAYPQSFALVNDATTT